MENCFELKICPTCGMPYYWEKRCECLPGQKPGEIIACKNATVFVDGKTGVVSGWTDNSQSIVRWEE